MQSKCNLENFSCQHPGARSIKREWSVCLSFVDDEDINLEENFETAKCKEGYDKCLSEGDNESLSPPPPQFLTSDSDSNAFLPKSPSSKSDETDRRIEEQQKQIDMLLKAVNARIPNLQQETGMELTELAQNIPSQSLNSGDKTLSSVSVAPLRVMVFIDGTWLYYSIHERQANICPIIAKLGRGWQKNYNFNWNELPRIICDVLQEQESKSGWLNSDSRPVEISRVNVFTSVKKNTPKHSTRLRMFDEMKEANYDVYMMETVGQGEKVCKDISKDFGSTNEYPPLRIV